MNIGEKPRIPNPTKLSEILDWDVDPGFLLSSKACEGILRRAERRGKELPAILKEALENQCAYGEDDSSELDDFAEPDEDEDEESWE